MEVRVGLLASLSGGSVDSVDIHLLQSLEHLRDHVQFVTSRICGLDGAVVCDRDLEGLRKSLSGEFMDLESAVYLGFAFVVVPLVQKPNEQFVNLLREFVYLRESDIFIVVSVPTTVRDIAGAEPSDTVWSIWVDLRTRLFNGFMSKLSVGIDFGNDVDVEFVELTRANRWMGEPLSLITTSSPIPVQTSPHLLSFLSLHSPLDCRTLLLKTSDLSSIGRTSSALRKALHSQFSAKQVSLLGVDVPQPQLKPTEHNLCSSVYNCFEANKDKYATYTRAVMEAAIELRDCGKVEGRKLVVLLVGAGRGGILRSILDASERLGEEMEVVAVEKNGDAFRTMEWNLSRRWVLNSFATASFESWKKEAKLVHCDLRDLPRIGEVLHNKRVDMVVSELLGSFGCNELSPELVTSLRPLTHPHTRFVPSHYNNYIQPVMSMKLHAAIHSERPGFGQRVSSHRGRSLSEIDQARPSDRLYVTPLLSCFFPTKPQLCFQFTHPNTNDDLYREAKLEFRMEGDCQVSGVAGYFTARLSTEDRISTLPSNKPNKDDRMRDSDSWFPCYFPFRGPVSLDSGDILQVRVVRKTNQTGLWYEWQWVTRKPDGRVSSGPVQNQDGISDFVKLHAEDAKQQIPELLSLVERGILSTEKLTE